MPNKTKDLRSGQAVTGERVIVNQKTLPKAKQSAFVRSIRRSPVGLVGMIMVAIVLFFAVFGSFVSPHDPLQHNLKARFKPPGFTDDKGTYVLGTDTLGRDMLSRVIAGSRVAVIVGLVSVGIAGAIGLLAGVVAGFVGGWPDVILMRVVDALLGIPFLVLVVAVSGVVGAGLATIILILGLTGWIYFARVVRGEVLVVRELEYITAARVIGQRSPKIMVRHILPNVLASSIVLSALQVGSAILTESSLSFLGLGVQAPTITWGLMLSDGRQYLGSAWWMATFPGIALTFTVLGVVFLGDWLRDILDPRLRGE